MRRQLPYMRRHAIPIWKEVRNQVYSTTAANTMEWAMVEARNERPLPQNNSKYFGSSIPWTACKTVHATVCSWNERMATLPTI